MVNIDFHPFYNSVLPKYRDKTIDDKMIYIPNDDKWKLALIYMKTISLKVWTLLVLKNTNLNSIVFHE